MEWLDDNHSGAVDMIYGEDVEQTPELLALIEQYTNEFVESLSDSGADRDPIGRSIPASRRIEGSRSVMGSRRRGR